jgi:hypothetical protein
VEEYVYAIVHYFNIGWIKIYYVAFGADDDEGNFCLFGMNNNSVFRLIILIFFTLHGDSMH